MPTRRNELVIRTWIYVFVVSTLVFPGGNLIAQPVQPHQWQATEIKPVEHSLLTDDPGKVHIDLWGWQTTPWYQRSSPVSPDYLKERAVDESYKWGANIVELFRGGYPLEKQEGWTKESTAAFHRHIHSRDMLVHWFPHGIATHSFQASVNAVTSLGRNQFDSLRVHPDELLDGMGTEGWVTMSALLFNKCMWPYSPFTYYYSAHHRFDETLPNEIDVAASSGYGVDDQTTEPPDVPQLPLGYSKLHVEIRKRYGLQFWASQAECRSGKSTQNPRYSGLGQPDWILKQANDQFRTRACVRGKKNISPSAIWWINEAEEVCPDKTRRYVYGISQDPVKCAVTAKFTGLGATPKARRLPQRYPQPSQTAFIQNNYFRILVPHDRDQSLLQYDLERLAHYDNNSFSIPISEPFAMSMIFADDRETKVTLVDAQHIESAGYKSVLQVKLQLDSGENKVDETRTFVVLNDTPYFRVRIRRNVDGSPLKIGSRFGFVGYDRLAVGEKVYKIATSIPPAEIIRLTDSSGKQPKLAMMILDHGKLSAIHWEPRVALTLESLKGNEDNFEIALVFPDGLYNDSDLKTLYKHLNMPEEQIALDDRGQATVQNPLPIPLTKVVRVTGAGEHPYQLFEFGRWVFRGAQPSQVHKGEDYLKCYMPANSSVRIQRYGEIEGIAKPGWGCQYTMALRELSRKENSCRLVAEVKDITSFIFAPRVQFKNPIRQVRVNGQEWRYFDGRHVFLPNRRGLYHVEAIEGTDDRPHLARTFACIENTSLCDNDNRLSFDARLPEWVDGIPDDFYFAALIRHSKRAIVGIENAEVVRNNQAKASIVRFKPGKIVITFGDYPKEGAAVPRIDPDAEIERYLSCLSAEDMMRYLSPFEVTKVSLQDAAMGKDTFAQYDVLIWNHYYLDALPEMVTSRVVGALREHLEQGRGLFLVANGVRILPELLGIQAKKPKTQAYIRSWGKERFRLVGIEALPGADTSPIFSGLTPMQPGGKIFAFVDLLHKNADADKRDFFTYKRDYFIDRWGYFKLVRWPESSEIYAKGTGLANLHIMHGKWETPPNPDDVKSFPILEEWQVGKGKVIGYSFGLPREHGSPDRWEASQNTLIFVQNVVRKLSNGKKNARVGVLW